MNPGWKKEFAALILDDATSSQAMSLKIQHFPRRLFRYGRFDTADHWTAALIKHQLWLSSPKYFNDPFDCELVMDKSIVDSPAQLNVLYRYIETFYPDIYDLLLQEKPQSVDDVLHFLIKQNATQSDLSQDLLVEAIKALRQSIYDGFQQVNIGGLKVLCFSQRHDSIIMWSHYAQNHTGFCVAYDFMSDRRLRTYGPGMPLYPNIWPVIYHRKRIDFGELMRKGKLSSPTNAALFKSPAWSYEQEWRLVWSDYYEETGPYVKDGGCMREIYLGAKVDLSAPHVSRLLRHAHKKSLPVYQMQLSDRKYSLKANKIQ